MTMIETRGTMEADRQFMETLVLDKQPTRLRLKVGRKRMQVLLLACPVLYDVLRARSRCSMAQVGE